MQILAIGYYAPHNELVEFTRHWEKHPHVSKVIRVSTDAKNRGDLACDVDAHLYDMFDYMAGSKGIWEFEVAARTVKFLHITMELQRLGKDEEIDYQDLRVYIQQSNDLIFDFVDSEIPVYYNQSQILKQRIPKNANIRGLICPYPGGIEELSVLYPEMAIQLEDSIMIPHGIPEVYYDTGYPLSQRKYAIGFKGSLNQGRHDSKNYREKHIYDERKRFLNYLQDRAVELNTAPLVDIMGPGPIESYIKFMHRIRFAINIPAVPGFINQRQYHAMALGCVLVQYKYDGIEDLGFKHKENCFLFSDEDDLDRILDMIYCNPKLCTEIRKNGIKFAKEHSFKHRAYRIMDFIAMVEDRILTVGDRWKRHEDYLAQVKKEELSL